jgi:hypothetical protein
MGRTRGATNKTEREHKQDAEIARLKARLAAERKRRKEAEKQNGKK